MQSVKFVMGAGLSSSEAIYSSISSILGTVPHSAAIPLLNSFGPPPHGHLELKSTSVINICTRATGHAPQSTFEPATCWFVVSVLAISCGLAVVCNSSPCSSGPPSWPPPPPCPSRSSRKQRPYRQPIGDGGDEGDHGDPGDPPPPPPPPPPIKVADPSEPEPSGFAITLLLLVYLAIAGAILKIFFPRRFASLRERARRLLSYPREPLVYDLPSHLGEPLLVVPVLREVQLALIPDLLAPKVKILEAQGIGFVNTPRVVGFTQTINPIPEENILEAIEQAVLEPVPGPAFDAPQIEGPYFDKADAVPTPAGRTGQEPLVLALFQLIIQFGWPTSDPRPIEDHEDIPTKPIPADDDTPSVSVDAVAPELPVGPDNSLTESYELFLSFNQSLESPEHTGATLGGIATSAVAVQEDSASTLKSTINDGTALDGSTVFDSFNSCTSGKAPESLNDLGERGSSLDLPTFASAGESVSDTAHQTDLVIPPATPRPECHSFEIGSYSNVSDLLADPLSLLRLKAHDSYCSFSGSESGDILQQTSTPRKGKEAERECSLQLGSYSNIPNLLLSSSSFHHLRVATSHCSFSGDIKSPSASEIESEGDSNVCQADFSLDRDSLSNILADLPPHRPKSAYNFSNYPKNHIKPETSQLRAPTQNSRSQPPGFVSEEDRSLDILELIAAVPAEFHERLLDVRQPALPDISCSKGSKKSLPCLVKNESISPPISNPGQQRSARDARIPSNTSAHRRVC